jgi:hypothetical protein
MACTQNRKRADQKARIHSGAVGGKQPGSSTSLMGRNAVVQG